jgi:hypothetical protein
MQLHEYITWHAQIFFTCCWVMQNLLHPLRACKLGYEARRIYQNTWFAGKDFNLLTRIAADTKSSNSLPWEELSLLDESSEVLICKFSNRTNKKDMRPYIRNQTNKQQPPTTEHNMPSIQMAPWISSEWTKWWFGSNLHNQCHTHF